MPSHPALETKLETSQTKLVDSLHLDERPYMSEELFGIILLAALLTVMLIVLKILL
jgi:hypothetical protein